MATMATNNPSVVTTPSVRRAVVADNRRNSAAIGTLSERALNFIGRTLLRIPPSTWLLVDVGILVAGVWISYRLIPPPLIPGLAHVALWQAFVVFAAAIIVASLVFGLYERETFMSRSRTLTRMGLTTATAAVVAYAIIYGAMYSTVGRRISAITLSIFFVGGVSVRLGAWWAVQKVHCGLLVVGSRTLLESFEYAQSLGMLHEYRLLGFATIDEDEPVAEGCTPSVGPISSMLDNLAPLGVTDLVVSQDAARDPRVMEWMVPCLQRGYRVTSEAVFYEKATGQILVDEITPSWFLLADLKVHCDESTTLKRLVDFVTAAVGLCLTAPLWPLIALAVKLCDGGPVFYSQDRIGQNDRVFKLFKFRTMRPDAESGKSIWASPNDPRVTRVGRFLRKTRLDELPQFYNVLVGQMSIVGPRPERPDIVKDLSQRIPFYAERHLVKPGITGWAQISFRYGASIEDSKRKLQYDLFYLKHMSFELDAIILFRTAGTFLRGGC